MFRWFCVVVALFGMMAFAACGGQEQAPPSTPGEEIEEAGEEMEEAAGEMAEEAEESAERIAPQERDRPRE